MTRLFKSTRHRDFRAFDLPAKSDGDRAPNQHGFVAPDGREWSVVVERAPVVGPDDGAPPYLHLWLTLADREDGRTRRLAGEPLVQQREELTLAIGDGATLAHAIEDAVAAYWHRVAGVPDAAEKVAGELAALGVDAVS